MGANDPESDGLAPLPLEQVIPLVRDYRGQLAGVLTDAWADWSSILAASSTLVSRAGGGSRGMLVSDLLREPAHRRFGALPGARVSMRYGQPWIELAAGRIWVRFRKLSTSLALSPNESERARRLSLHLGDPLFPEEPAATVLTAGYILNPSETRLAALALVCHVGAQVHYKIDLPLDRPAADPAPNQLPMAPPPEPIIRRSQDSARRPGGAADGRERKAER